MTFNYEERHKRGTRSTGGAGRVPLPNAKSIYSHDRSSEVVFKVASYGKSIRSVKQMMEYISMNSEHILQPEPLMNDMGSDRPVEDIDQIIKGWDLKKDSQNLSKKAYEAESAVRRSMPEKERLDKRQAMHSIISFPKWMDPTKDEMKEIALEVMDPFFRAGYESVFVPHIEADNRHIHIITNATSMNTGKQIRINRNDIQAIRERIADISQKKGYDLKATRRAPSLNELSKRDNNLQKK